MKTYHDDFFHLAHRRVHRIRQTLEFSQNRRLAIFAPLFLCLTLARQQRQIGASQDHLSVAHCFWICQQTTVHADHHRPTICFTELVSVPKRIALQSCRRKVYLGRRANRGQSLTSFFRLTRPQKADRQNFLRGARTMRIQ